MDHQPACLKFALIGHQDSWDSIKQYVNTLLFTGVREQLSQEQIQEVYGFIPPRKLFGVTIHSTSSPSIKGVYIETFISPDELGIGHLRKNVGKVREACLLVAKLGAPVVSLGGFTSILLEADNQTFTNIDETHFTTGNTLTAAFIADGVKKACEHWGLDISQSALLIIGSTGDIGSACVRYFSGKAKELLLCARRIGPLKKQSADLSAKNIAHRAGASLREFIPHADIIISVASSHIHPDDIAHLPAHCVVCDAGYPKNFGGIYLQNRERLFHGGMGIVNRGFEFERNANELLYKFPVPGVAHGCMLEAIVLALENEHCAFSKGRGNITVKAMRDIKALAEKHGIVTAPLFNNNSFIHELRSEQINECKNF